MNLFYAPGNIGDTYMLDEVESKHAVQVLRLKEGDEIILLNGTGIIYSASIIKAHPKKCEVEIISSKVIPERNFKLHVAVAPTKNNDRFEWFLEKATEIGMSSVTPVICDRSERRATNHERFDKVIIAAMKQSMHAFKPVLNLQSDFRQYILNSVPGFIAHCMDTPKMPLKQCNFDPKGVSVLIGPEGDFTAEEVAFATQNGWTPVSLGSSRLRTETAALVAVHTVNLMIDNS
jgi:16S rRNA (uracil1498-N3)-methyltransferase